ncbi:MAG: glutamine-hydrolyzing GMP synthase [Deferribacteres bacterium]|nr:glutamine-hydrolyzing GMP synthase [candidate division KSB1 bacterium]MCB9504247.1 glutamine-hydrolyzing GMP synthase [Deferribacteres bacterium]
MSELHTDSILILDFGSQYTQLIARKIREIGVYGEIKPYFTSLEEIKKINPKGLVLSGGPNSVYADGAPHPDAGIFELEIPILGICYGLQLIVQHNGGKVKPAPRREYGRAVLEIVDDRDIFAQIPNGTQVWMSHGDSVTELPVGFSTFAKTGNAPHAAIAHAEKHLYGLQFHPEVAHTELGTQILRNFAINTCGCDGSWTPENFIQKCVQDIREKAGSEHVLCALSGGVDSAVAAALIYKALGEKLHSVFVDTGLMRLNEAKEVTDQFSNFFGSGFTAVDAETRFLNKLSGVDDPEKKRKIIGEEFIRVFEEEAKKLPEVRFLVQGTLYPDVIESVSPTGGPSVTIKSHHNVGGLPEKMHLDLIEPLRELFKDEVRQVGKALGLPDEVLGRHPFPGPGLAVRILGKITRDRIEILQKADAIYIEELRKSGWYDKIWQAFAVLLPVHTVGVMGDQRTYENAVALRAVTSTDGMTADWGKLPYELLGMVSNRIINEVKGINRVVYDISSKPPATIEWE